MEMQWIGAVPDADEAAAIIAALVAAVSSEAEPDVPAVQYSVWARAGRLEAAGVRVERGRLARPWRG